MRRLCAAPAGVLLVLADVTDGARLVVWTCGGGANQRWTLS